MMYLNDKISSVVPLSTTFNIFRKSTVIDEFLNQKRHPKEVGGKDPVS